MKLTKHQKNTIHHIFTGEIYDITSYLNFFNLGTLIKYNKESVIKQFESDNIPKIYYCPKTLQHKYSNMIPEQEYLAKLQTHELDSEKYSSYTLHLSYNTGIKTELWEGSNYTLNFYEGVYVANSFQDILEFLTLWQYLKSEMLILEVPHDFCAETLGLFYKKAHQDKDGITLPHDKIKNINFADFTYDDQYYLNINDYVLSKEHCIMCKEYMDKRLYPSAKLGLYIKSHFTTYEEKTQNRVLFVAWLAIFVSVGLTFAPYLHQNDTPEIDSIANDIRGIKSTIDLSQHNTELMNKLDDIYKKLDELIESSSTPESTSTSPNSTAPPQNSK